MREEGGRREEGREEGGREGGRMGGNEFVKDSEFVGPTVLVEGVKIMILHEILSEFHSETLVSEF